MTTPAEGPITVDELEAEARRLWNESTRQAAAADPGDVGAAFRVQELRRVATETLKVAEARRAGGRAQQDLERRLATSEASAGITRGHLGVAQERLALSQQQAGETAEERRQELFRKALGDVLGEERHLFPVPVPAGMQYLPGLGPEDLRRSFPNLNFAPETFRAYPQPLTTFEEAKRRLGLIPGG